MLSTALRCLSVLFMFKLGVFLQFFFCLTILSTRLKKHFVAKGAKYKPFLIVDHHLSKQKSVKFHWPQIAWFRKCYFCLLESTDRSKPLLYITLGLLRASSPEPKFIYYTVLLVFKSTSVICLMGWLPA